MLNYILILGAVQGILLSAIILLRAKYVANRFLGAFVALLGFGCLLDNSLHLVEEVYYIIFWIGNSFLFGPVLYLYVRHVVEYNKSSESVYTHFFPFILVKILVLGSFFIDSLGEEFWVIVGVILNYALILFNFVYLYMAYKCIANFSQKRETHPKNLILIIIGVYTIYNVIFLIRRIIDHFSILEISLFENYLYVGVAFLIYLISASIIYRPDILKQQRKYSKSFIGSDKSAEYGIEIEKYLKTMKPFTDENFTLKTISSHLQLQKHHVSQIIGQHFNMTFYELLNHYRIEEFCQRIARGEHKKKSILGVAMDCGYKSKSTFNAAFKKLKKTSPSEYLKQL